MSDTEGDKVATVTIFGFGSLMDVQSARRTMPSATNFRKGILQHHQRVYSLVSIGSLKSGRTSLDSNELAALAARPASGSSIRGVLFDIPQSEFGPYMEREHRYLIEERPVLELEGVGGGMGKGGAVVHAFTCLEQSDEQYMASLRGGHEEWQARVGQYYPSATVPSSSSQQRLWGRRDIVPMTVYMANVMVAASTLDEGGSDMGVEDNAWLRDAVDNTFLVDGSTSLREYVLSRLRPPVSRTDAGGASTISESNSTFLDPEFAQVLAGKKVQLHGVSVSLLEYLVSQPIE